MFLNLFKSVLHNIGVIIVGFIFALIGKGLDSLLGTTEFYSFLISKMGLLLLLIGFLLRVWATFQFYEEHMKVISLKSQRKLITTGAFGFSRNPLYLGGNVFIFLGASLVFGSPMGVVLTILNIIVLNFWMIPREEKQLENAFGRKWIEYRKKVRRWI